MKITAVDPLALGYRKTDPPMARNFAVVRIETDAGLVGWGEASTNWGHMYPTVFVAAVRDVCAMPLLGTDPTDVRGRLRQIHVILDGYIGWDGLTSQVVGGDRDGVLGHRRAGVRAAAAPPARRGQPTAAPLWHGHDDVRGDDRLPRPLLRRAR